MENGHVLRECEYPVPAYVLDYPNIVKGTEADKCEFYISFVEEDNATIRRSKS